MEPQWPRHSGMQGLFGARTTSESHRRTAANPPAHQRCSPRSAAVSRWGCPASCSPTPWTASAPPRRRYRCRACAARTRRRPHPAAATGSRRPPPVCSADRQAGVGECSPAGRMDPVAHGVASPFAHVSGAPMFQARKQRARMRLSSNLGWRRRLSIRESLSRRVKLAPSMAAWHRAWRLKFMRGLAAMCPGARWSRFRSREDARLSISAPSSPSCSLMLNREFISPSPTGRTRRIMPMPVQGRRPTVKLINTHDRAPRPAVPTHLEVVLIAAHLGRQVRQEVLCEVRELLDHLRRRVEPRHGA
jgi:hypothetical protein